MLASPGCFSAEYPYILGMADISRPEARYRHVLQEDGSYGVEVAIEGTNATIVTPFVDPEAADRWIAAHKLRASQPRQRMSYGSRKWTKPPATSG